MERKLILAYDASLDWHYTEEKDFRRRLVEFLLANDALELKSYVSSTIIITFREDSVLTDTSKFKSALSKEFLNVKFVVGLINSVDKTDRPRKHSISGVKSGTIEKNFDKLVNKI